MSLPSLYGQITRPKQIEVSAYNLHGQEITGQFDGLMARVVQHELDHLDGVIFPDRMSETGLLSIQSSLEEFELEFNSRRSAGEFPNDQQIAQRLTEIEKKYC